MYETWYENYHRRIYDWTSDCSVRSAEVVLMLPDLVQLLLDLSRDSRVAQETRRVFHETAETIMCGVDYLPEGVAGTVGLIEDAVSAAKHLHTALPTLHPDALAAHWRGERPLPDAVDDLLHRQDDFAPRC